MKRLIVVFLLILVRSGYSRAKILKKLNYFHEFGENNFIATIFLGTEPKHISFGNNVWLATRVSLITHDVSVHMCGIYKNDHFDSVGSIKFGDNIFIGAGAIVLPNVSICSNVIVGAGAIVSKSIEEEGVYVGSPLRKVSSFDTYVSRLEKQVSLYPWKELLKARNENRESLKELRRKYVIKEWNE